MECPAPSAPCSTRQSCHCPASGRATATQVPAFGPGRTCHTWQGCDELRTQLGTAAGERKKQSGSDQWPKNAGIAAAQEERALPSLAQADGEAAPAAGRAARRGHRPCQAGTQVILAGWRQVPLKSSKRAGCSRPLPPKRLSPLAWRVWEPRRANLLLESACWGALGACSRPATPVSKQDIPLGSAVGRRTS